MKFIQSIFTVTRKEYITPHYIRVFFTGKKVEEIAHNTTIGANNKILIFPKKNKFLSPFSHKSLFFLGRFLSKKIKPIMRTYTHRGFCLESNEIWIDFVAHSDRSPASSWAINAHKGDTLVIRMKNFKKPLYPKINNYLLVGDATAIPVLGAILESLPENVSGTCIIEVHGKEDEQHLKTKANIEFKWLHNKTPGKNSALLSEVEKVNIQSTSKFAYVAAEFSSVKSIRKYFKDNEWSSEEFYAIPYWDSQRNENEY